MNLTPNSHGSLREANDCHLPGGSPAGGQFCRLNDRSLTFKHEGATALDDAVMKAAHQIAGRYDKGWEPWYRDMGVSARGELWQDEDLAKRLKKQVAEALGRVLDREPTTQAFVDEHVIPSLQVGKAGEDAARWLISSWARTSGDSDEIAIGLQEAAQRIFPLQEAETGHFMEKGRNLPIFEPFIRAQYAATQAWFKARGITEVTLYRGMIHKDPPFDLDLNASQPVSLSLQPISSFSTDIKQAHKFADATAYEDGEVGMVLGVRVPVWRILSTPLTGFGCLREKEVTVLGGVTRGVAYAWNERDLDSNEIALDFARKWRGVSK